MSRNEDTHRENTQTKAEDSFTDESNPSCSKLTNKNETQPSKADAVQDNLCSQTLVAEDMKFICKRVVDTDNVCEEDPPSLDTDTKSLSKTSVGTETSTEVESLPSKSVTIFDRPTDPLQLEK